MKHAWIKALIILLVMGPHLGAAAQENAFSAYSALSEEAIDQRIHFIEERLDARKERSRIWFWSWMAINGGSAVGFGAAAGLSGKGSDRVNYGSQATLAALGVGDLLFRPLEARYGAEPIRSLPADSRSEKEAKLRAAEDLLHANARRAVQTEDWIMHFANLLLNAAAGVAAGMAGDSTGGAINAGVGFLLGEAYILSEPIGPKTDWEDYETMISSRASGGIGLSVEPSILGLTLKVTW